MHLVSPSSEYEDAYLDFAMELRAHGDGRWVEAVQRLGFGEYLLKKQREERGEGLEPDIVPVASTGSSTMPPRFMQSYAFDTI